MDHSIQTRVARAEEVVQDLDDIQIIRVRLIDVRDGSSNAGADTNLDVDTDVDDGIIAAAIAYPQLTGRVRCGDRLLLNTTAVKLNLGTGGYHYVMARLDPDEQELKAEGHIMKMRYTPLQLRVLSVEEEASPHRQVMLDEAELSGTPVLTATLHSLLAPLCIVLHEQGVKTAFVMTDGAALPMAFSNMVRWLKNQGMLLGTVTAGHSFGGDLEAVNVYSGMLAARKVLGAEVIIVAMGPGIVGTGTRWGFTGVEQGEILNAVAVLGGWPVAVPRISFSDSRLRHQGISHHTLTALGRVCLVQAHLPLPILEPPQLDHILGQARSAGLEEKHRICLEDGRKYLDTYIKTETPLKTMGRGVEQEPEFFAAAAASAMTAVRLLRGEPPDYLHLI